MAEKTLPGDDSIPTARTCTTSPSGTMGGMADDWVSACLVIDASAEAVFEFLADPANHAAIDGTGWVRGAPGNPELVTAAGQVFRMNMYHPNHPNGDYQMANLVEVFEPPTAICWKPGYDKDDGTLGFGGWTWRYDLVPDGPARCSVTLTYDWSAVSDRGRKRIGFPPFPPDHLANSLAHLASLVTG